jgi:hypothetical protein
MLENAPHLAPRVSLMLKSRHPTLRSCSIREPHWEPPIVTCQIASASVGIDWEPARGFPIGSLESCCGRKRRAEREKKGNRQVRALLQPSVWAAAPAAAHQRHPSSRADQGVALTAHGGTRPLAYASPTALFLIAIAAARALEDITRLSDQGSEPGSEASIDRQRPGRHPETRPSHG